MKKLGGPRLGCTNIKIIALQSKLFCLQVIVTGDTVLCVQAAVLLGHLLHLVAR